MEASQKWNITIFWEQSARWLVFSLSTEIFYLIRQCVYFTLDICRENFAHSFNALFCSCYKKIEGIIVNFIPQDNFIVCDIHTHMQILIGYNDKSREYRRTSDLNAFVYVASLQHLFIPVQQLFSSLSPSSLCMLFSAFDIRWRSPRSTDGFSIFDACPHVHVCVNIIHAPKTVHSDSMTKRAEQNS